MAGPSFYSQLDKSSREIRLLDIVSATPTIVCRLSTVSLHDEPNFTALSYVWGDPNVTELMIVNDTPVQVTANLASALRDVHCWFQEYLGQDDAPRRLWADALCINQSDTQEKNHQVPLMGAIYSGAARVLSWIGTPSEKLYAAFEICETIASETSILPKGQKGSLSWLEKFVLQEEGSILKEPWDNFHAGSYLKKPWDNIHDVLSHFLGRPYWQRVWIFQELVLAQTAILISGDRSVDLATLLSIRTWYKDIQKFYTTSQRPHYIDDTEWTLLHMFDTFDPFMRISFGKDRHALSRNIERFKSVSDLSSEIRYVRTVLSYGEAKMFFSAVFQATNPKDYVYGFSAVSSFHFTPDYSESKSVADVYVDFVEAWLQTCPDDTGASNTSTAVILSGALGPVQELWFLRCAGIGYHFSDTVPGLPSWAPNFSGISSKLAKRVTNASFYGFSDIMMAEECCRPTLTAKRLSCCGIIFGQIEHVHGTFESGRRCPPLAGFENGFSETMSLDDIAKLANYRAALIRLLVKLDKKRKHCTNVWDVLGFLNSEERAIEDMTSYSAKFQLPGLRLLFSSMCELCGITSEMVQSTTAMFDAHWTGSIFTGHVDLAELRASGYDYSRARNVAKDLCLASTTDGQMGLFPPLIAPGDVVGILKGFEIPVALRKVDDGYLFVGTCSLNELTEGQAAKLVEEEKAKTERIELI